jgi:hypothetical protein
MRKTVYSNYEEKKLYIHEEGVGNRGEQKGYVTGTGVHNTSETGW